MDLLTVPGTIVYSVETMKEHAATTSTMIILEVWSPKYNCWESGYGEFSTVEAAERFATERFWCQNDRWRVVEVTRVVRRQNF